MEITIQTFLMELIHNPILIIVSVLVLGLMLVNGMTDAPNAIATCISTRAIKPKAAVIMASIFDALGVFLMTFISSNVISTMTNLVSFGDDAKVSLIALCAGIISAILWALLTKKFGIPSSESHALIAGITGAAIAISKNLSAVNFDEWKKVLYGLVLSSVFGFIFGFLISKFVKIICKAMDRRKTNKFFKKAQVGSGALMAFMHGAQDGQKFMGIFLLGILLTTGTSTEASFVIPMWLIILCSLTMGIGVLTGGYKIIKMVGIKMVKMEPYEGTCADAAGIACLLISSFTGVPVSTTHTKTTAIMGVGASKRLSNVNWSIAKSMVVSWFLVFPGCGILGFLITQLFLWIS